MKKNNELVELFKQSSKTYYYSSRLFPRKVRNDTTILYAFVRKADNFVDKHTQDIEGLHKFIENFERAYNGLETHDLVVNEFVKLFYRRNFKKEWVDDFFYSMKEDLRHSDEIKYHTQKEIDRYIYGSAETIGLFMSKVMGLSEGADYFAKKLGYSMQYINFIRDIKEDLEILGRVYIPLEILKKYNIESLDQQDIIITPDSFNEMIRNQIKKYREIDDEARQGFRFIKRRIRVAVETAADLYRWTAEEIYRNPLVIYEGKIVPSKLRIASVALKNLIKATFSESAHTDR